MVYLKSIDTCSIEMNTIFILMHISIHLFIFHRCLKCLRTYEKQTEGHQPFIIYNSSLPCDRIAVFVVTILHKMDFLRYFTLMECTHHLHSSLTLYQIN